MTATDGVGALTLLSVDGGAGDDIVNIRDNTADVASGGEGNDSVVADGPEPDTLDGFEAVERPPVATPPPVVTPPPLVTPPPAVTPPPINTATRAVVISGGTAKVIKGRASIKVRCPAASPPNCTGALTLQTAKRVRIAGRKIALKLGSTRYSVARGTTTTLKVKLVNGSQRLAGRNGHLLVLARASTRAPARSPRTRGS